MIPKVTVHLKKKKDFPGFKGSQTKWLTLLYPLEYKLGAPFFLLCLWLQAHRVWWVRQGWGHFPRFHHNFCWCRYDSGLVCVWVGWGSFDMRNCCYQTNKVNSLGIEVCTCSFALYGIQMFSSVEVASGWGVWRPKVWCRGSTGQQGASSGGCFWISVCLICKMRW